MRPPKPPLLLNYHPHNCLVILDNFDLVRFCPCHSDLIGPDVIDIKFGMWVSGNCGRIHSRSWMCL